MKPSNQSTSKILNQNNNTVKFLVYEDYPDKCRTLQYKM